MDDLIIPKHALDEMQRDSLTEDDVYAVVRDYDESIEQDTGVENTLVSWTMVATLWSSLRTVKRLS
jgi:hypothetical protein